MANNWNEVPAVYTCKGRDYFVGNTISPSPQQLISDGNNLWIYDLDLEQVSVRRLDNSIDDSPAAILGGDVAIEAHYQVLALPVEQSLSWFELTPLNPDSQYAAIKLAFKEQTLHTMVLLSQLGQNTRILFSDVVRNGSLAPGLFDFTVPEGVDLIDSRQPLSEE